MIGKKQALKAKADGIATRSIILVVGNPPKWFDPDDQDRMDIPLIYTEMKRPKPKDCDLLKGIHVQLLQGEGADDKLFASWFVSVRKADPKNVVALDSAGEFYVC